MKYREIILGVICLVCIFVFCYIATTGKIFTLNELPLNFMSAFLGAIVTAVLTLILLRGQSSAEEIKERNVIVFNKKSAIFEEFINRLYSILQEQKINGSTYREIKTEFYTKLVLYLKEKSQKKITDHLYKLVECIVVINDIYIKDEERNDNFNKLKENIFSIINILIDDIGLGGKMDIKIQDDLEKNTFPYLFNQTLLEEVNNLFVNNNNAIFEKASFWECIDGIFIIIPIKGRISSGGRIEIGPFSDSIKGESYRKNLIFRLLAPYLNPLVEPYASDRESNVEGKYINFYCEDPDHERDQIDLSFFKSTDLDGFEKFKIEKENIYKGLIFQFGFDDGAYDRFCGFYLSVCKSIAARAYYHFLTATADKDNTPIKELCEKFGEVTYEDITYYAAKK